MEASAITNLTQLECTLLWVPCPSPCPLPLLLPLTASAAGGVRGHVQVPASRLTQTGCSSSAATSARSSTGAGAIWKLLGVVGGG